MADPTPNLSPPEPYVDVGADASWLVETWRRVRGRPDLIFGLTVLGLGTALLCWFGSPGVNLVARILVMLVGAAIMVAMTLGMLHDYTDSDERDSERWIAELVRRSQAGKPPEQ